MMMYEQYKVQYILNVLNKTGFTDVEMRMFFSSEEQGFCTYFFGRKGSLGMA